MKKLLVQTILGDFIKIAKNELKKPYMIRCQNIDEVSIWEDSDESRLNTQEDNQNDDSEEDQEANNNPASVKNKK